MTVRVPRFTISVFSLLFFFLTLSSMVETSKSDPVVVLGARGGTGRAVVEYLKAAGHRVVAVARNATAGVVDGVEWVPGDVTDEASLKKAFKGAKGVVFAASASKGWSLTQSVTPRAVDYRGCERVARIAVEEKVPRVVVISSIFVTRPYHPVAMMLSTMFGRIMYWKRLGELAAIEQTKAPGSVTSYTVVRPGGLKDAPAKGREWVRIGQGDNLNGAISRADVALVTVEALFSAKAKNTVFEVVSFKAKPQPRKDLFANLVQNDGANDPTLPFDKENDEL